MLCQALGITNKCRGISSRMPSEPSSAFSIKLPAKHKAGARWGHRAVRRERGSRAEFGRGNKGLVCHRLRKATLRHSASFSPLSSHPTASPTPTPSAFQFLPPFLLAGFPHPPLYHIPLLSLPKPATPAGPSSAQLPALLPRPQNTLGPPHPDALQHPDLLPLIQPEGDLPAAVAALAAPHAGGAGAGDASPRRAPHSHRAAAAAAKGASPLPPPGQHTRASLAAGSGTTNSAARYWRRAAVQPGGCSPPPAAARAAVPGSRAA